MTVWYPCVGYRLLFTSWPSQEVTFISPLLEPGLVNVTCSGQSDIANVVSLEPQKVHLNGLWLLLAIDQQPHKTNTCLIFFKPQHIDMVCYATGGHGYKSEHNVITVVPFLEKEREKKDK